MLLLAFCLLAATPPESQPQTAAVSNSSETQRIRELIYFFRTYRVFCQDEEWAQTIRELAAIGKPAVPDLVAELDRTDRDGTIRSLAFCLRAIGDPRAVPGLIRALPKALRPPGSDCGVYIVDPALRRFMHDNQVFKNDRDASVGCGRPVNEIFSALERITNHKEPGGKIADDPLRMLFLADSPNEQIKQRASFEERRKLWDRWWTDHRRDLVTEQELQSAVLPPRQEDVVEIAGVAKYGPLFPTGPGESLGPVKLLRLTLNAYMESGSNLDLDTGRVFSNFEGLTSADWKKGGNDAIFSWSRKNGIDIRCQNSVEGVDLQLWLIDNNRWDSLQDEIRGGGPLKLGRETNGYLTPFGKDRNDLKPEETGTFLFKTREGRRGIIQVFPKDIDSDRYRIRYRLWSKPLAEAGATKAARGNRTPFGKVVTTTLDFPAAGSECLLDLETGRRAVPPANVRPERIHVGPQDDGTLKWVREQGFDLVPYISVANFAAPVAKAETKQIAALIGIDMAEARMEPQSFDEIAVEEAKEILNRLQEKGIYPAWMDIAEHLSQRPDTFAFKTRSGTVGLLQLEKTGEKLTIRYRLEPK